MIQSNVRNIVTVDIPSPVGQSIEQLLAPRARRQLLPGFDAVYSDIVDYILRCTHRIWEEKNVGLCRTHYSSDCVVHTLAGETIGAEAVLQNTLATLATFPDRTLIGEDVIWNEEQPGRFHTSHRIMSKMTHLGEDGFGTPTGRRAQIMTIADCVCEANRIVEEWLVRDNLLLVKQLGLDPVFVAKGQAEADLQGDPLRHLWRAQEIERVRKGDALVPPVPVGHGAYDAAGALSLAFTKGMLGEAARAFAQRVEGRWPSGRHWFGRGGWIGAVMQLLGQLENTAFLLDHWAATPAPNDETAIAIRWSLTGRHAHPGIWGEASGRDLLVLAVSHFRVAGGKIIEDITVFDELAILRQIAGGLGA